MSEPDASGRESPHRLSGRSFGDTFVDDVMADVEREVRLAALLSRAAHQRLHASFHKVVMGRVHQAVADRHGWLNGQVSDVLSRWFPRIAVPLATIAVLALIGNMSGVPADTSLIDALLGLHAADGIMLNILQRGQG